MRTDGIGIVSVVVPYGRSNAQYHALTDYIGPAPSRSSRDTWVTLCGRDASGWSHLDDQNIVPFMESAYTCKKCAEMVLL